MDKTVSAVSPKRGNKQLKSKKKQAALKVVYITNPMKFNATASEFRALVQELTGQDADVSDSSRFAAAGGVSVVQEEAKVAAVEGNADAVEEVVADLSTYEDDGFCSPVMIDNFEGLVASSLWHGDVHADVFKNLG